MKGNKDLGWTLFWLLLISVLLFSTLVFEWLLLIYTPSALIFVFVRGYRKKPLKTLWVSLLVALLTLGGYTAVFTFSDDFHFITGTDWKRIDTNTCEKETIFKGVVACSSYISRYADSLNGSAEILISQNTVPECYEERCR